MKMADTSTRVEISKQTDGFVECVDDFETQTFRLIDELLVLCS